MLPKWSRKRWIAETTGGNLADYEPHQPSLRASERRLPIYSDGTLAVCVLPSDAPELVERTLDGRQWKRREHWRYPGVVIYTEIIRR